MTLNELVFYACVGMCTVLVSFKLRSVSLNNKKRSLQILQDIGKSFPDFGPLFCCCLYQDPLKLTFESDLAMDEVLTEIGCLGRMHNYEYLHISYGFERAAFYLIGENLKIRFELRCQSKQKKTKKAAVHTSTLLIVLEDF